MNLFFRLLCVFFKAYFSKKDTHYLDETEIRSRVMLTDQDMFAHMTNSRYFSFSDLATIDYIIRTNAWALLRKRGWMPVVASEAVAFRRMLRAHQAFKVTTRLVGWNDTYLCLEHRFVRDEEETALLRVVARFASRKKSERVLIKDVTKLLGITQASPPLPREFQNMIDDIQTFRDSASAST
ncbi:thioesterase family protein [Henriciella sp. AS95]|uniref:thioesterase family protein n=1 Tax=Henriciella sp. AS95 TaxID=3135782 RepID=UPI00316BB28E